MWEESQAYPGDYGLSIYELLPDMGYDWLEIYREFMAVNTVMDYDEQDEFPAIALEANVSALPAEGQAESGSRPQSLGQNYIRIKTDTTSAEEPDLLVQFTGQEGANWMVILVGTIDDRVEEVVELEFSRGHEGSVRLEDLARFDDAFLVVSPLTGGGSGADYEWTATAAEAIDTGDDDDDGGDDDDDDDGGDGCTCRAEGGGAAPVVSLAALALAAIVIRWRR